MTREEIHTIVKKDNPSSEEMEKIVEEYIFEKKNVRVKIDSRNSPLMRIVPDIAMQREAALLSQAYKIASEYYLNIKKDE